jgi:hypothetical protein
MLSGPPTIDFTVRVLVSPFQTAAERKVPIEANLCICIRRALEAPGSRGKRI